MSGSQIQLPQFQGYQGQNVDAAPVFQAAKAQGQNAMDMYKAQSANSNAMMGGLFNLGTSAIAFSDARLKTNVVRVGTHPLGVGIYEYDIFDHRERGVMAQEVEAVRPEAVIEHSSGYKMVNYGALDG